MTTSAIRTVCLVGPRLTAPGRDSEASYLWVAELSTDLEGDRKPVDGVVRAPSLRVLAQRAQARAQYDAKAATVDFRDPLMFQLAVRGYPTKAGELRMASTCDGSDAAARSLSVSAYPADPRGFSIGVAAMLASDGKWPAKRSDELETSPLSLTLGAIDIAIRDEAGVRDVWNFWSVGARQEIDGEPYVPIFGGGIYLKVVHGAFLSIQDSTVKGKRVRKTLTDRDDKVDRIILCLTPAGIEFDAVIDDPFGSATQLKVRLRLEPDGAGGQRVALLREDQQRSKLRPTLDDLAESVRTARLGLVFDIRPGLAPLVWPVEQGSNHLRLRDGIKRPSTLPGAVRASLVTERMAGASLEATATLINPVLTIDSSRPMARQLTLDAGKQPAASEAVATVNLVQPSDTRRWRVGFGQRKGSATASALPVLVERLGLARDLEARYRRQALRTARDPRPLYGFVALERGVVQIPLAREPDLALRKAVDPAPKDGQVKDGQALVGLVHARLTRRLPNAEYATVGELTVDSAAFVRVSVPFSDRAPLSCDITLSAAHGAISGALWFNESSPTAQEVVPVLDNGPITLRSGVLSFGETGTTDGQIAALQPTDDVPAVSLDLNVAISPGAPVVHWAPVPGVQMPLVAGMNMTRSAPSAVRPSCSRDLVPVFYHVPESRTAATVTLTLQGFSSGAASIVSKDAELRFGWPGINAQWAHGPLAEGQDIESKTGIAMSVLTLPGVEVTLTSTTSNAPGLAYLLRYDLPVLGELYAEATFVKSQPPATGQALPQVTALDLQALESVWAASSHRLSLTRTDRDRMTGWYDTKADGLVEPYTWETGFTVRTDANTLPYGAYALAGEWTWGEHALAGLNRTFGKPAKGDKALSATGKGLEIVGFALAPYRQTIGKASAIADTRGLVMATTAKAVPTTLSVRSTQLLKPSGGGEITDLITTREEVPLTLHGAQLALYLRDVPMQPSAGGWVFSPDDTPESAPGPDSTVFARDKLPRSIYEWRLYASAGASSFHDLVIGPLTLRPLRLWHCSVDVDGIVKAVSVLFGINAPYQQVANQDEPFGPESPFDTGNSVCIAFKTNGGPLVADNINDAVVQNQKINVATTNQASITLRLDAKVLPGAKDAEDRQPVTLRFNIQINAQRLEAVASSAQLDITLFGARLTLTGGTVVINGPQLNVSFKGSAQMPEYLTISTLTLDLSASQCLVTVNGVATLPDRRETSLREAIRVSLGGPIGWYGASIATDSEAITVHDHPRGVLSVELNGAICKGDWLRGLNIGTTRAHGIVVLTVQAPEAKRPMAWKISSARFDVTASNENGQLQVTQLTRLQNAGAVLTTDIRVTLPTPDVGLVSVVQWPVGRLGQDATKFIDSAGPYTGEERTLHTVEVSTTGTVLTHVTKPGLADLTLDCNVIGVVKDVWLLTAVWRSKVLTTHRLSGEGQTSQVFDSLDDVAIVDLAHVARRLADPRDPFNRQYGFVPRYRLNGDLTDDASPLIAGIGRGGLFGRDIDRVLVGASKGGAVPALVIFAGALIEVSLDEEQVSGVVAPLPWIAPVFAGAAEPLSHIPQAPEPGQKAWIGKVAGFDLASAIALPLNGLAPLAIGLASNSAVEVRQSLLQMIGVDATTAQDVIDQAFAANLFPSPASTAPFARPLFWRSLMALARWWRVASTNHRVNTLLARPGQGDAVRVQVVRHPPNKQGAAGSCDLVVAGRWEIAVAPIPGGEPRAQDAGFQNLVGFASTLVQEPLAVFAASVMDAATEGLDADQRNHASLQRITLRAPFALQAQGRLRDPNRAIYPSPALSWPRKAITELAWINTHDEAVIQDAGHAWAGRARTFAGPCKAAVASDKDERIDFLAIGRRILFSRGGEQAPQVVSPPDRALTPATPRARVPLAAELAQALSKNRLKDTEAGALTGLSPGQFEVFSNGVRPGVMALEHEGFVSVDQELPLDSAHARFGRPADRAPLVWRQGRAPRNTALPRGRVESESRRTFVAANLYAVEKGASDTRHLQPFVLFSGPGAVLRYLPALIEEAGQEAIALLLSLQSPDRGWLSPELSENVVIRVKRPGLSGRNPLVETLAKLGLLVPGLQATLEVGDVVVRFAAFKVSALANEQLDLTLAMSLTDRSRLQAAVRGADADTQAMLRLELAPWIKDAPAPAPGKWVDLKTRTSASQQLPAGPPLRVTFRLMLLPGNRLWRPVEMATLAFADPAYDRELASPAHGVTKAVRAKRYLLAFDRAEYDSTQTLCFSFGRINEAFLRPDRRAVPPLLGGKWSIGIEVTAKDPALHGSIPRALGVRGLAPEQPVQGSAGQAYAIEISALVEKDGTPAALASGDQLTITAVVLEDDDALSVGLTLNLNLSIVDFPVNAPAAAIYGLVSHEAGRATPELFASAPQPSIVEFPELVADLVRGHVRRKAMFVWPFVPRNPITPGHASAGLVKIDRTGGGQIPEHPTLDFPPAQ